MHDPVLAAGARRGTPMPAHRLLASMPGAAATSRRGRIAASAAARGLLAWLAASALQLLPAAAAQAQAGDGPGTPPSAPAAAMPNASAVEAPLALPTCREQRRRGGVTPALFHGKWQGQRAGKPVLLYFKNNPEMPGSLVGEYRWNKRTVEIAGDNEGLALNLEESDNGRDVTGVWELRLCNRTLSGQWLDANYANAQPVALRRVGPEPRP